MCPTLSACMGVMPNLIASAIGAVPHTYIHTHTHSLTYAHTHINTHSHTYVRVYLHSHPRTMHRIEGVGTVTELSVSSQKAWSHSPPIATGACLPARARAAVSTCIGPIRHAHTEGASAHAQTQSMERRYVCVSALQHKKTDRSSIEGTHRERCTEREGERIADRLRDRADGAAAVARPRRA
jgi:hypothetical protein